MGERIIQGRRDARHSTQLRLCESTFVHTCQHAAYCLVKESSRSANELHVERPFVLKAVRTCGTGRLNTRQNIVACGEEISPASRS